MRIVVMKRALLLVAGASLVAATGGCAAAGSSDGRVSVVASIYPLAYVAERIGGDHVDVRTLTQPGQEPHDLELSIARTAEVADADLLLYGKGFQPAVDDAVDTTAQGEVVEALDVLQHGPDAIEGPDPVKVIEDDPHFWLDPHALATVAVAVEKQLEHLDPQHAKEYEQGRAALVADLTALDHRYSTGLAHCARRTVVVSHDAFGYLGSRYDLDFEPITGLSPEAEPSPARLAELEDLVRKDGLTTVFSETLVSPQTADALASDVGVDAGVLGPIEGLTDRTAHEDYLSLMDSNLAALRKANGC
jgi:zinc transport system substrate-binding protein